MAFLKIGKENTADIELWYEDRGTGAPVVLIHGWPFDSNMWERQTTALLAAGYRVITYDRRGFGRSSAPSIGYDYDTLAADTDHLVDALNLSGATLVGFSMGGGEVARYMSKHNQGRVTKVVFISSITPAVLKSSDNPEGADGAVFDAIREKIEQDRYEYLLGFVKEHYNHKLLFNAGISDGKLQADFVSASRSDYRAMRFTLDAWMEDFRADLAHIDVPTLVIHGDADQLLPLAVGGARMPALIPKAKLHVVAGGSHGLIWTQAAEANRVLLEFLGS